MARVRTATPHPDRNPTAIQSLAQLSAPGQDPPEVDAVETAPLHEPGPDRVARSARGASTGTPGPGSRRGARSRTARPDRRPGARREASGGATEAGGLATEALVDDGAAEPREEHGEDRAPTRSGSCGSPRRRDGRPSRRLAGRPGPRAKTEPGKERGRHSTARSESGPDAWRSHRRVEDRLGLDELADTPRAVAARPRARPG